MFKKGEILRVVQVDPTSDKDDAEAFDECMRKKGAIKIPALDGDGQLFDLYLFFNPEIEVVMNDEKYNPVNGGEG